MLSHRPAQLFTDDARGQIGRAAGTEADNDADGTLGIISPRRRTGAKQSGGHTQSKLNCACAFIDAALGSSR